MINNWKKERFICNFVNKERKIFYISIIYLNEKEQNDNNYCFICCFYWKYKNTMQWYEIIILWMKKKWKYYKFEKHAIVLKFQQFLV